MKQKLKRWEIALMAGVLCALVLGVQTDREQRELADSLIRLHVIANSDSAEDQELKLLVRDAMLEQVQERCGEVTSVEEMETLLRKMLPELAAAGEQVVRAQGQTYPVRASVEQCYFPTKEYEDFALPAGEYTALRLEIGAAQGQNWWCVAFPPLCIGAAGENLEQARQAGIFTKEQTALVTEADGGYVLRFKTMELLGAWKQWLKGQ